VLAVVGAERHLGDLGGDLDAAQGAGEGLLALVGVKQDPGAQHRAVGPHHIPLVGIVVPARVAVAHAHHETPGAVSLADSLDLDHVGLARPGRPGGQQNSG
jgi:hypothetical protein